MFKIYFNDKPLFLTDRITAEIEPYAHHDDAVLIDEFSTPAINSLIHEMKLAKIHAGIFIHPDVEALRKAIWKKFTLVKAAGGIVYNDKKDILFIFRRNKWDLPKGKLDPGESLEQCAVREVEEETGLRNVKLDKHLVNTYHTYEENGKSILKESWWYILHAPGHQPLVPQTAEQITGICWVNPEQLDEQKKNTFPSILDVLQAAGH